MRDEHGREIALERECGSVVLVVSKQELVAIVMERSC